MFQTVKNLSIYFQSCGCNVFSRASYSHVLFVIFQRRNFHQGPFRVGAMHGLAVVPQSLLREPFRVANGLGTFRPSVAVAVQRHAVNAKLPAA